MDQITHFLNVILNFLREGYDSVNAVEGLVIALVAAIIAPAWDRIWAVALGATAGQPDRRRPHSRRRPARRLPPAAADGARFLAHRDRALCRLSDRHRVLMFIKRMFLSPPAHAH
ncbi:MAG: hypothetical protein WDM81_18075 [Rhizomicrobium sp.]